MAAYFIHTSRKLEALLRGDEETSWVGELKTAAFWRACGAEFLATMLFVFIGCSAGVVSDDGLPVPGNGRVIVISMAFGLGIMAMVMLTGHISGGHINPAVTIAFAVNLAISPIKAVFYVVAQLLGAVAGAGLVYGLTNSERRGNVAANSLTSITPAQGFGYELIITFILVSVIMATTDGKRTSFAGVGMEIGLTVALCHFAGIRYTGASMNPARSFGSAVVGGYWTDHWVYWAGPILGGCLAAVVYKFLLSPYRGTETIEQALKLIETGVIPHGERTNMHEMEQARHVDGS